MAMTSRPSTSRPFASTTTATPPKTTKMISKGKKTTVRPKSTTQMPTVSKSAQSGAPWEACAGRAGLIANPVNCSTFYFCGSHGFGWLMSCGDRLGFNPAISGCDWKHNIPGCVEHQFLNYYYFYKK
jgi:hypothetical protein